MKILGTEVSLEMVGETPSWELTPVLQEMNMMVQEGPFIVINKFTSLESLLSQYFPHLQYICPNMWAGTLKGSHKQLWLVQATGTYF